VSHADKTGVDKVRGNKVRVWGDDAPPNDSQDETDNRDVAERYESDLSELSASGGVVKRAASAVDPQKTDSGRNNTFTDNKSTDNTLTDDIHLHIIHLHIIQLKIIHLQIIRLKIIRLQKINLQITLKDNTDYRLPRIQIIQDNLNIFN